MHHQFQNTDQFLIDLLVYISFLIPAVCNFDPCGTLFFYILRDFAVFRPHGPFAVFVSGTFFNHLSSKTLTAKRFPQWIRFVFCLFRNRSKRRCNGHNIFFLYIEEHLPFLLEQLVAGIHMSCQPVHIS